MHSYKNFAHTNWQAQILHHSGVPDGLQFGLYWNTNKDSIFLLLSLSHDERFKYVKRPKLPMPATSAAPAATVL